MGGILSCIRCSSEETETPLYDNVAPPVSISQSQTAERANATTVTVATQPTQPSRPLIAIHPATTFTRNQTRQMIPPVTNASVLLANFNRQAVPYAQLTSPRITQNKTRQIIPSDTNASALPSSNNSQAVKLLQNQTRQVIPPISSTKSASSTTENYPALPSNRNQSTAEKSVTSKSRNQSSYASIAKRKNWNRPSTAGHAVCAQTDQRSLLPLSPTIFTQDATSRWEVKSVNHSRQPVFSLVDIHEYDDDYQFVFETFCKTAQRQLKIVKIQRVENLFLMGCYLLKKEELEMTNGFAIEMNYFHGTKKCNLMSICEGNFDWRLNGTNEGHMFGQGVSFSNIATYASHYCDKTDMAAKTMFLARVLESQYTIGSKNMVLPPVGFDTAKKANEEVIVKFSDNEFYPEFIIYFTGSPTKNY